MINGQPADVYLNPPTRLVKRVVALPGDTVFVLAGTVTVLGTGPLDIPGRKDEWLLRPPRPALPSRVYEVGIPNATPVTNGLRVGPATYREAARLAEALGAPPPTRYADSTRPPSIGIVPGFLRDPKETPGEVCSVHKALNALAHPRGPQI